MKSLIFALFLYVSLVWVGAVYLYSGPKIQEFGLLWTIIGLIALLAIIAGARLWGWWRLWRAKSVGRPAVATKPAPIIHEDDAALAALIAEANANLAKAPADASRDCTARDRWGIQEVSAVDETAVALRHRSSTNRNQ